LDNKKINLIDVNFNCKNKNNKISFKSKKYINACFDLALKLMKNKIGFALINGPISKKHFLEKKFLGITEYLARKTSTKNNEVMLIYNDKISVSPITTHLPLKEVSKKINTGMIVKKIKLINSFYKKYLNKKIKFAVCGLNPHCETINKFSEEDKIIKPAIKILKRNKINVEGPLSADTLFMKKNIKKYDVFIGMYHDQVLGPIKALFGFNSINITLGLPFIRISPDHGPNNLMFGKNKSDPNSLIESLSFLKKISAN
jgi:4-hydroxythreonine-4-phosphate dehydrogenase